MNSTFLAIDQLRGEQADLSSRLAEILRNAGWTYTSRTPGSYWVWTKTFPEHGHVMAPTDLALRMEESWQESLPENFREDAATTE